MQDDQRKRREFARVEVELRARIRPLGGDEAVRLRKELAEGSTVWAPANEGALREVALSSAAGSSAMLAQAVLDLAEEVVRLRNRLEAETDASAPATIEELSGGGCRMSTPCALDVGSMVELRFDDPDRGIPPVRALAEIAYLQDAGSHGYGVRFAAIHGSDRERLIRYLYRVQRERLRGSHASQA